MMRLAPLLVTTRHPETWIQHKGVWTLLPARTTVQLVRREPVDLTKLIACPTCRATVVQTCRSASGHTREPHATRLAPRLCPCGSTLAYRARYCEPCAAESIRVSKRDYLRRRRAAERVAA